MNAQISIFDGHSKRQKLQPYLMDARKLSKYLATSFNGRGKSDEQPTASVLFLSRVDHVTELSGLGLE